MATGKKDGGSKGLTAQEAFDKDEAKAKSKAANGADEGKGPEAKGKGHNSELTIEEKAKQVAEFLEAVVDEVDEAIEKNNRENTARNQPHRKRMAGAFKSLVKDGVIPSHELTTMVAERRLMRKLDNIDHKLTTPLRRNETEAKATVRRPAAR